MSLHARIGLSLPNRGILFGLSLATLLDVAVEADRSGLIDSIWVGDNLTSKPRMEAIVLLSAVAARTDRVRLGTICMASFPLRHPLLLAIQWASLDLLSSGRTVLAICIGGSARDGAPYATELAAMGVESNERVGRLEEGVELIRRLWTEEGVEHAGTYYSLSDITALPRPFQPRVPILIAGNPLSNSTPETEERVLRRVARFGDGWQTDGTPVEMFRERWQRIRTYAAEYGRADAVTESNLHLMVNINDDASAARREALEFLDRYYGVVGGIPDEKMSTWLALGSPREVAERIATYIEAGCSTPVLRMVSPDQRGQLDRLLGEVIPQL